MATFIPPTGRASCRAIYKRAVTQSQSRSLSSTISRRSELASLEYEMQQRKIAPVFDDLSPQSSYRLDVTLADHLPGRQAPPPLLPSTQSARLLPMSHHLVYFEPTKRGSEMLADGTNPDQSPGEPFVRRMWAGGQVAFNTQNPLRLDGGRGVCAEFIRSVTTKGKPDDEKLFVAIERRVARLNSDEDRALAQVAPRDDHDVQAKADLEHAVRQRLWRDSVDDFGPCAIVETRNIVFMRARTPEQARAAANLSQANDKIVRPIHQPDYSHTVTPDAKLLFRFSALTFNAHAIHLDPEYCRKIEGHRDLLFHGPLSFVFMMSLLDRHLQNQITESGSGSGSGIGGRKVIKSVDYRNLAPLYCHEPVTFCGTRTAEDKYEIWTQTPQGGLAVKGSVITQDA